MSRDAAPRLADRLARTLIAWVGGVWLVSMLGVAWYVDREINLDFDSEMAESAHRMLDIAVHDYDLARPAGAPPPRLPLLGRRPLIDDDPVVFQLAASDGALLMRSDEAPSARFAVQLRAGFEDAGAWRVYTVAHPSRPLLLHLADPLDERLVHRRRTLLGLVVPLVAVLPLLAWLLRRLARRELRGLDRLARQIGRRDGTDLSRLELDDLPAELRSVGDHVNRLLRRLDEALDTERSLAANAAHELRTPLASARLRLQTALDVEATAGAISRADVEAAARSLAELAHRADKLLQLSRAESAATLGRDAVDLVRLAALVLDEFASAGAPARRVELELVDDAALRPAEGDADSIAIALRNLVENALRHAPGARVAVRLEAPCTIAVVDDGPGVPAGSLQILQQRHVRRSADAAGYGLGLSIVASIAARHGAAFELRSPRPDGRPGLEARLVLRPAAVSSA